MKPHYIYNNIYTSRIYSGIDWEMLHDAFIKWGHKKKGPFLSRWHPTAAVEKGQ